MLLLFFFVACAKAPLRAPSSLPPSLDQWSYWPLEQEGCTNVRDQFLEKTSALKVTYTKLSNLPCHVDKGRWKDFFTGEVFNRADDAIVTTIIPLQHLKNKGMKDMPLVRLLGLVRDENYLIVLKKGGAGEELYLKNSGSLITAPETNPGKCEFWGMWKEMKEKWSISFKAKEKRRVLAEAAECEKASSYDRKAWKHWSVLPNHQCDSRLEVLEKTSYGIPKRVESTASVANCPKIESGVWNDPYTGLTFTDPHQIDIDHFVPLMNAYISGGWKWPQWKKELYANYQRDAFHLVAVSASENRKKGARHPGLYMPPLESYHCDYLTQWAAIKLRWGMSFGADEYSGISTLMSKCSEKVQSGLIDVMELLRVPAGTNQNYQ